MREETRDSDHLFVTSYNRKNFTWLVLYYLISLILFIVSILVIILLTLILISDFDLHWLILWIIISFVFPLLYLSISIELISDFVVIDKDILTIYKPELLRFWKTKKIQIRMEDIKGLMRLQRSIITVVHRRRNKLIKTGYTSISYKHTDKRGVEELNEINKILGNLIDRDRL